MKKEELQKLSTDKLKAKVKGHKTLIGIFIGLIAFFIFILVTDYLNGKEMDWTMSTIMICSLGGMVSIFPELKDIQKELATRNH